MAYILGDIADKVRARVRDSNYDTTETRNYINDTQNDVFNEYYLRFMETTQTYTLTAGVSDITNGSGLPTNFVQAINLMMTSNGLETLLEYKDFREIDFDYPSASTDPNNIPKYWYIYGDTIRVYPAPASAYTVSLRYLKKPTILSSDSDVPEIPSEFEEVLVTGAAYRILQVKDNYDQAALQKSEYTEKVEKLVARYGVNQTGTATRMRVNKYGMG